MATGYRGTSPPIQPGERVVLPPPEPKKATPTPAQAQASWERVKEQFTPQAGLL